MPTITIEEAQANLPALIEKLTGGMEFIVITRNAHPVAKLISAYAKNPTPVFGRGKGKIEVVAEDDEHLQHFEDYMP